MPYKYENKTLIKYKHIQMYKFRYDYVRRRIITMGYFPFFIDIKGKKGLIIGGGRIAEHKLRKILPYEPDITVVATRISDSIKSIDGVKFIEREFVNSDLEGCAFCIAATDDKKFNAYVAGVCRKYHIFINVVDDKDNCQFLFPSVYKAGNLSIGISTQGASPYVASDIKNHIVSELPLDIEDILDYLCSIRESIKEKVEESSDRAAIFKTSARRCMVLGRRLDEDELDEIINDVTGNRSDEVKKGKVVIAGAGCGAYDLITMRALNAVKMAGVLIYDDLIDERILEYTPESCEKIYVGKRNNRHSTPQNEINELLLAKAGEGKLVVRLKGGDPYVFGRGAEEILYLKEHGIETEEIPGISSSIAVPAMAGIPVTHRNVSRSFTVITGHTATDTVTDTTADNDSVKSNKSDNTSNNNAADNSGAENDNIQETERIKLHNDIKNSAAMDGTCIYLMGLTHLKEITDTLMEAGKPQDTPAAVISGGFDGTYKAVKGTLKDIAVKTANEGIQAPAVIVTGDTVNIGI